MDKASTSVRVSNLFTGIKFAIHGTKAKLTLEKFLDCFPVEFVTQYRPLLIVLYQSGFHQWETDMEEEFSEICKGIGLVEKLIELDDLCIEQSYLPNGSRRPPVAEVSPSASLEGTSLEAKEREEEALQQQLNALVSEGAELKRRLEEKRAAEQQQLGHIEEVMQKIHGMEASKLWNQSESKDWAEKASS